MDSAEQLWDEYLDQLEWEPSAQGAIAFAFERLRAAQPAAMARLSASEVACYRWPEDTAEHRAMRAAFCDGAAQPQQEPVAWEDMPETRRLLKTITAGVECSIDGNLATVFISNESDPSVGLDGGLRLSLSCNYEVIPLSFLNDIKRAMGNNWERSLDLWRQIHEPSAISSTPCEAGK